MVSRMQEIREAVGCDVLKAAPMLLGARLVKDGLVAHIVETEAYRWDEEGCHAFRGRTQRNEVMFGPAGIAYVYFTYGMHWMLNVTCQSEGQAAAVLIRAAEPAAGIETMRTRRPRAEVDRNLLSGPAKLTAAFGITGTANGTDLLDPRSELHIEPGRRVARHVVGTRIGLAEGKGTELLWRFADADAMPWVSRPHPRA